MRRSVTARSGGPRCANLDDWMLPPALRHKDFRNYLAGAFVSNVGSNVQAWAIAWHVYDITHSSLMVGMLGIVRVVPLLVFALLGGVLADQADRRKVMIATQSAMALVSLGLVALAGAGVATVWPLYAMVAVNAVARAFDGPARQSLQVSLVPLRDFPNAASLNGVAWRLSDVLGPVFAGLLLVIPSNGLTLCYALNFVSFFAVLVAVWRLGPCKPETQDDRPKSVREVMSLIGDGLRFVNKTPVIRHAMWIDFWATLFSGAEALLPAFAGAILHLGPEGYGLLAGSTGFGALLAAASLSWMSTVRHQGRWVVVMIAGYGVATIGFGLSQTLWMACFCLACVGATDMVSTVMRQTIRQLATPDELRGRMSATSSLFHISGPQLGDFEAGAVAHVAGERFSIVLGGGLCLFVALWWSRAKALVGYEHDPDGQSEQGQGPGPGRQVGVKME